MPGPAEVIALQADEAGWVRRLQAGDRTVFPRIVARHQSAVLAYCARCLGDLGQAKDCAQEVFLTLWRERAQYEHRGRLRAFLIGVARHRCLALLKKRHAALRLADAWEREPRTGEVAVPDLDRPREAARVARALTRVDEARAEIVRLRFLDGLSPPEIADVLGVPEGTVKSRLSRGLADLKKELADGP